jgi:hypothetical protein
MTVAPTPTGYIALDPAARLLLLCARPELRPAMRPVLRELVTRQPDWERLIAAARCNFIVVLLRKHLIEHAAELLPNAVAQELDRLRTINAARSLEIVRMQRLLASKVLRQKHARHAFFKGATLSHQYYGDTYLRQYRDVDLLLDRNTLVAVGTELIREGYSITKPTWCAVEDFDAYFRFNQVLELRSPSGISVELHRTLDKSGCIFPNEEFLAASVTRQVDGAELQVLPSTELFVYLCFHHSKHRWSCLHWCADLDAFLRHPDLDHTKVDALARRLGLSATVDESLKLRLDLEKLALYGELPPEHASSRLLDDCISALNHSLGKAGTPPATGRGREPDFAYPWQKTRAYRWRVLRARLHPAAYDYYAWPLPTKWHWLYYFVKPLRVLWSRLGRPGNREDASR